MDHQPIDLFRAAREGDLERCKMLIEKGFDPNAVNEYDATPLYFAALCGHTHIVQYLLENGAVANEGEHMGERIFYAALNDDLRRLLKSSKLTRAYRSPFIEFLRLTYENRSSLWPDLVINHHGGSNEAGGGGGVEEMKGSSSAVTTTSTAAATPCHRVIMRARSPYFKDKLRQNWRHSHAIRLADTIAPLALKCVMQYIYSGTLEMPSYLLKDCLKLCRVLKLDDLRWALKRKHEAGQLHTSRQQVIRLDPQQDLIKEDFSSLAQEALTSFPADADVVIFTEMDGKYFSLHRVFLQRSEFFKIMFSSAGFQEGVSLHERDYHSPALSKQEGDVGVPSTAESSSNPLPTISLRDISADAFSKVIEYLYSDQLQELNLPLVFEVLEAATRFLLPGLRAICGAILIEESHQVGVFDLHSIARMYDLPRLENHCFYLFARDLDDVVATEEFGQLVRESAMTIQSREDIDSIPFLDEIRFHVSQCHKWDQEELERKYSIVDELLDKLELGA